MFVAASDKRNERGQKNTNPPELSQEIFRGIAEEERPLVESVCGTETVPEAPAWSEWRLY